MVAWNGQYFHGRLLGKEGLRAADIEKVLPRPYLTREEKQAERTADLARKMAAVNAIMSQRAAKGEAQGNG